MHHTRFVYIPETSSINIRKTTESIKPQLLTIHLCFSAVITSAEEVALSSVSTAAFQCNGSASNRLRLKHLNARSYEFGMVLLNRAQNTGAQAITGTLGAV